MGKNEIYTFSFIDPNLKSNGNPKPNPNII